VQWGQQSASRSTLNGSVPALGGKTLVSSEAAALSPVKTDSDVHPCQGLSPLTSQSTTVVSTLPEARRRPSLENAKAVKGPAWPANSLRIATVETSQS
jgi:hypothetical protein